MPDKGAMITLHHLPLPPNLLPSTALTHGGSVHTRRAGFFMYFLILNQIQNYNIMEGRGEVLAFFRPMIPFSNPLALQ